MSEFMDDIDFDKPCYWNANKYFAYKHIHKDEISKKMSVEALIKVFWSDGWGETYEDYHARVKDCKHEDLKIHGEWGSFESKCNNCNESFGFRTREYFAELRSKQKKLTAEDILKDIEELGDRFKFADDELDTN